MEINCRIKSSFAHDAPKETQVQQSNIVMNAPAPQKKKKKISKFKLTIVFLFLMGFIIAINVAFQPEPTDNDGSSAADVEKEENTSAISIEFDERSWGDFLKVYEAHNQLMKMMGHYSNNRVGDVDFYNFLDDAEDWFRDASVALNYAKNADER